MSSRVFESSRPPFEVLKAWDEFSNSSNGWGDHRAPKDESTVFETWRRPQKIRTPRSGGALRHVGEGFRGGGRKIRTPVCIGTSKRVPSSEAEERGSRGPNRSKIPEESASARPRYYAFPKRPAVRSASRPLHSNQNLRANRPVAPRRSFSPTAVGSLPIIIFCRQRGNPHFQPPSSEAPRAHRPMATPRSLNFAS